MKPGVCRFPCINHEGSVDVREQAEFTGHLKDRQSTVSFLPSSRRLWSKIGPIGAATQARITAREAVIAWILRS